MFGTGSVLDLSASAVGLLAGGIGIGGFLGHVSPALRNRSDFEVRRATIRGGIGGLGVGLFVIVLSALVS